MRIELRPCEESDREWAYALKSEAYREVVERQFGPWDEDFQRTLFATRWRPEISQLIVIDGVVAGLVAWEDRADELWLDELQLSHAWRGRSVGTEIMRTLMEQAKARQKPLRLQVLKMNTRAQALYGRLGFRVTSASPTHHLMAFGS